MNLLQFVHTHQHSQKESSGKRLMESSRKRDGNEEGEESREEVWNGRFQVCHLSFPSGKTI